MSNRLLRGSWRFVGFNRRSSPKSLPQIAPLLPPIHSFSPRHSLDRYAFHSRFIRISLESRCYSQSVSRFSLSSHLNKTDEAVEQLTGASGIMSGAFGAHALKARLGDQAATWVSLDFARSTRSFDRVVSYSGSTGYG